MEIEVKVKEGSDINWLDSFCRQFMDELAERYGPDVRQTVNFSVDDGSLFISIALKRGYERQGI